MYIHICMQFPKLLSTGSRCVLGVLDGNPMLKVNTTDENEALEDQSISLNMFRNKPFKKRKKKKKDKFKSNTCGMHYYS